MDESDIIKEFVTAVEGFFAIRRDIFDRAVEGLVKALRSGHKILLFGNGGSAAEAQHFAAEMGGRFLADRRALPAIALAADAPSLTAVANDMGFETVFARQIEALGRPGDAAVALTTSGSSANIIAGLKEAKGRGLLTVALTGEGGGRIATEVAVDILLDVPSKSVPRIQEVHLLILHLLAGGIEKSLIGEIPL
jgi:D-sedoheptulose 7-phosphate isomerase